MTHLLGFAKILERGGYYMGLSTNYIYDQIRSAVASRQLEVGTFQQFSQAQCDFGQGSAQWQSDVLRGTLEEISFRLARRLIAMDVRGLQISTAERHEFQKVDLKRFCLQVYADRGATMAAGYIGRIGPEEYATFGFGLRNSDTGAKALAGQFKPTAVSPRRTHRKTPWSLPNHTPQETFGMFALFAFIAGFALLVNFSLATGAARIGFAAGIVVLIILGVLYLAHLTDVIGLIKDQGGTEPAIPRGTASSSATSSKLERSSRWRCPGCGGIHQKKPALRNIASMNSVLTGGVKCGDCGTTVGMGDVYNLGKYDV